VPQPACVGRQASFTHLARSCTCACAAHTHTLPLLLPLPTSAPPAAACCRFFYASSACIYPEHRQLETEVEGGGLKESDAWPAQVCLGAGGVDWRVGVSGLSPHWGLQWGLQHALLPGALSPRGLQHARLTPLSPLPSPQQPQDSYGLEKLATEELCMHYNRDFGIECRIARFHNIYGPYGTWKGGREKAPAAFCRKVRGRVRVVLLAGVLCAAVSGAMCLAWVAALLTLPALPCGPHPLPTRYTGPHQQERDRDVGRRQADAQLHVHRRLRGGHPARDQV
jgi:hypothetical protein